MVLVEFLQHILNFFYNITASYGLSIIFLSLFIMIIMLPFYWLANKIKDFQSNQLQKIKLSLNQFKNIGNKREKFFYTKEVYRKNNYKPYYSLLGLIGLLIQVPFFLAVYWMLLDNPLIQEISFGPIKDLSKPDELLKFNGFSINILPVIMTIINLYSVFYNTINLEKSEKYQLLVIALLFLIFLYDLPSSLVLYWTMNNFFSIPKDWILLSLKNTKIDIKLINLSFFIKVNFLNLLNRYKFYFLLLLFSITPLLSVYYINIDQLYDSNTAVYILSIFILVFTFLICLLVNYLFKDKHKAFILIFMFLFLFFSFGHINEFIWR